MPSLWIRLSKIDLQLLSISDLLIMPNSLFFWQSDFRMIIFLLTFLKQSPNGSCNLALSVFQFLNSNALDTSS